MGMQINFDDPVTLWRLNPDGESAQTMIVHKKADCDAALADGSGWTAAMPKLDYPRALYSRMGKVKIVGNRAEEKAEKENGFTRTVAAPPYPAIVANDDTGDVAEVFTLAEEKKQFTLGLKRPVPHPGGYNPAGKGKQAAVAPE